MYISIQFSSLALDSNLKSTQICMNKGMLWEQRDYKT